MFARDGVTHSIARSTERAASLRLDEENWKRWTGVTVEKTASISYRVPDGPLGRHRVDLGEIDGGTVDVRPLYGLRFEAEPSMLPYSRSRRKAVGRRSIR